MPGIKKGKKDEEGKLTKPAIRGCLSLEFSENTDNDAGEDAAVAVPDVIHLIPVGQWEHPLYGPLLITASDIREFAQNFSAEIRKGVYITAGHEGFNELPAVGWIKETYVRDDGLWGKVEWNEYGKEALHDKQYKFFSPEFYQTYEDPETRMLYHNVLIGGALTKSPYFKGLEAVVFSEPKQFNSPNNNMNLQELLAKKIEDLSDEEKSFIKEHKAELSEDQKVALTAIVDEPETAEEKETREKKEAEDKAAAETKTQEDANVAKGLNPDGTAKVEASEKVLISASELAILRHKADEGALAMSEIRKAKLDGAVSSLLFSESNRKGSFLPKSKDTLRAFMETLNDDQRLKFSALIAEIPAKEIFTEKGTAGAADGTVKAEVDMKVESKLKDNPKMKYSDALREVMSENEGLEERYDRELVPVRGKKD